MKSCRGSGFLCTGFLSAGFVCSWVLYHSLVIIPLLLLLVLPQSANAQRSTEADFDADGISDFVLINPSGNILSWSTLKVDGSSQRSLGQFGRLGHDIAMGDWLGQGIPQPATVSESRGKIVWRIFSGGVSTAREFGSAGETVLAGGDFNNDGVDDAVTVVAQGAKLKWRVHQSLFTNSAASPLEITFGRPKDLHFYYNPDGQGDRIASITRKGAHAFLVRYLNPFNGKSSRKLFEKTVPSPQFKQSPLPLRLNSGKDGLLFYQRKGDGTSFSLVSAPKNKVHKFKIQAQGDIITGNFSGDSGEEIAVQGSEGFQVHSPATKTQFAVSAPSGIAVDEININTVGQPSSDGGGGDVPPGNEPPLAGLAGVCARYSSIGMGEMLIKSQISQHIPGEDPRATGYTVVCGRLCPKNLSLTNFYYANGSYAGSVAYYGRFSGNGQPRLYGAVGQAPQHFADQIAAAAQTIGNGKLYIQISEATSGSGTECKEFNPTGRNGSPY